jgi:glycosyltransferase involved in cell wall biosynthesis
MTARVVVGTAAHDPDRQTGLDRYTGLIVPELMGRVGASVYGARSADGGSPRRLSATDPLGNLGRFLWMQTVLPRELRRSGAELYYSPVQEGMLRPPCRQIITIHDLIPLRFPDHSPRMRYYFKHVLPGIVRASSGIVVVSAATERDVRNAFEVEDRPMAIAPPAGPAPVFRRMSEEAVRPVLESRGIGRYLLAVGTARHKNLDRLLGAFERLPLADIELVIVGSPAPIEATVASLRRSTRPRVKLVGRVSDETLAAMYNGASAFVFPSLQEGFGIPPLEAMACGTPVVASSAAAVRETCGDAAAYFDPEDVEEMARVITRVLVDDALRRTLRDRGGERVSGFGVGRSAAEIIGLMEQVLAN